MINLNIEIKAKYHSMFLKEKRKQDVMKPVKETLRSAMSVHTRSLLCDSYSVSLHYLLFRRDYANGRH